MPSRTQAIERVDASRYRIVFDRPLEPEIGLMYFGFYPNTELHWHKGKVVAVVASVEVYERLVRDFAGEEPETFGRP